MSGNIKVNSKRLLRFLFFICTAVVAFAVATVSFAAWTAGSTSVEISGTTGIVSGAGITLADDGLGDGGKLYPFSHIGSIGTDDAKMLTVEFDVTTIGNTHDYHYTIVNAPDSGTPLNMCYWKGTGTPTPGVWDSSKWEPIPNTSDAKVVPVNAAGIGASDGHNVMYIAYEPTSAADMNKTFKIVLSVEECDANPCTKCHNASHDVINGGFETATRGTVALAPGWTMTEGFGSISSAEDYWAANEADDDGQRPGLLFQKEGTYFFQGNENKGEGTFTLTSSDFLIGGSGYITFRLGASGYTDDQYVEVVESGTNAVLARYINTGFVDAGGYIKNSGNRDKVSGQTLIKYKADLTVYKGRTAYVRLTDKWPGAGIGFMLFDDLVTYYAAESDVPDYTEAENKMTDPVLVADPDVTETFDIYDREGDAKTAYTFDLASKINANGHVMEYTATGVDGLTVSGSTLTYALSGYTHEVTTRVITVTATSLVDRNKTLSYTITLNIKDTSACHIENGGFENETDHLDGWTMSKDGLGAISNINDYWDGLLIKKEGTYFFHGHENKGDTNIGTLTSPQFVVGGSGYITFRLGAAGHKSYQYVEVVDVDTNTVLAHYTNRLFADNGNYENNGNNADAVSGMTLMLYKADLSAHKGKTVVVRVTDNWKAGGIGFVLFDDLVTYYAAESDLPIGANAATAVVANSANKTTLNEKIAAAQAKREDDYTATTFAALTAKLAEAIDLASLDYADQAEVDAKATELQAAIDGLVSRVPTFNEDTVDGGEFDIYPSSKVTIDLTANVVLNGTDPTYYVMTPGSTDYSLVTGDADKYEFTPGGTVTETVSDYIILTVKVKYGAADSAFVTYTYKFKVFSSEVYRIKNGNFADGLIGWNMTGDIGTVETDKTTFWDDNRSFNSDGAFFYGGDPYETNIGTLTSSPFYVSSSGWITYKLGGGKNFDKTYISVINMDGNELVRLGNTEWVGDWPHRGWEMFDYKANLISLGIPAGTLVRLRVVDNATGDYGMVNLDKIVTNYSTDPGDDYVTAVDCRYIIKNGSFEWGNLDGWVMDTWTWAEDAEEKLKMLGNVVYIDSASSTSYESSADWYDRNGNDNMDGKHLFTFAPSGENYEDAKGVLRSSEFTLRANAKISFRFGAAGGTSVNPFVYVQIRKTDGTVLAKFYNDQAGAGERTKLVQYAYEFNNSENYQCYFEVVDLAAGPGYSCFVLDDVRLDLAVLPTGAKEAHDVKYTLYNGSFEQGLTGWTENVTNATEEERMKHFGVVVETDVPPGDVTWYTSNSNAGTNVGKFFTFYNGVTNYEDAKGDLTSTNFVLKANGSISFRLGAGFDGVFVQVCKASNNEVIGEFVNSNSDRVNSLMYYYWYKFDSVTVDTECYIKIVDNLDAAEGRSYRCFVLDDVKVNVESEKPDNALQATNRI